MAKLLRQNVGGVDYTMAGCALTGVCASSAADFVKAVTLSDGDTASDGMTIACTFVNGNSVGTAPDTLTIYSSDQVNYYSDSELTQPFTLAPSGCYTIEYTGEGNAYTYQSYPIVAVGNVSGPLCDTRGKPIGGALWDAGDIIMLLYTGGKFLVLNREAASYDFAYYATGEETVFVIEVPYINNSNTTAIGSILINARYGYKYVLDFYAFINESSMSTTAGRVGKVKMTDGAISGGNYLETTLKWDVDTTNKKIKFYLKKTGANTRITFKVLQNYEKKSEIKFSTTTATVWNNAQYYNYFEYTSPIDSVTSGNLQPVTSNAVANATQDYNKTPTGFFDEYMRDSIDTEYSACADYSIFYFGSAAGKEFGCYGFKHNNTKGGACIIINVNYGVIFGAGTGLPSTWNYKYIIKP